MRNGRRMSHVLQGIIYHRSVFNSDRVAFAKVGHYRQSGIVRICVPGLTPAISHCGHAKVSEARVEAH
jgi:hypothetical protein